MQAGQPSQFARFFMLAAITTPGLGLSQEAAATGLSFTKIDYIHATSAPNDTVKGTQRRVPAGGYGSSRYQYAFPDDTSGTAASGWGRAIYQYAAEDPYTRPGDDWRVLMSGSETSATIPMDSFSLNFAKVEYPRSVLDDSNARRAGSYKQLTMAMLSSPRNPSNAVPVEDFSMNYEEIKSFNTSGLSVANAPVAPSASAIPEPASLTLLLAGFAGLLRRR